MGLGGLQAHEHVGLGLLPGPIQLGLGDAVVGEVADHGQDGVQGLALGLLPQGGVDAEVAGVVVAGAVGVDGVAQALLLPHLLEQAGGHAAPQDGGQQLHLEPPGVCEGDAGEGQGQVVLLDGLLLHRHAGDVGGGAHGPAGPPLQPGEAVGQGLGVGVGEAARQGHHDAVGAVVLPLVFPQPGAVHLLQGGLPPQDGPGQGGALEHRPGQPLGAQILRVVLVHADLLQDNAPLGLHIGVVELGVEEHVAQDVRRLVQVGVQHPGVEAGALLGGEGVDLAPHRVHLLGQLPGGAPAGALEQHVLDEVGRAVLRRALVAGAGAHPDAQGRRAHPGHVLRQDPHPVGERLFLIKQTK